MGYISIYIYLSILLPVYLSSSFFAPKYNLLVRIVLHFMASSFLSSYSYNIIIDFHSILKWLEMGLLTFTLIMQV